MASAVLRYNQEMRECNGSPEAASWLCKTNPDKDIDRMVCRCAVYKCGPAPFC